MGSSGHTSRHRKRKRASSTTASDASRDTTNARRPPPPALHQDVFHGLRICLTGHRDKRAHMAACVKRFGGQWSPGLRRDVDVLIAEHAGGDKYAWARKWGVAVVERRWYMDSMARGCAVGVERYRLAAPSVGAAEGEESGTASARARVLERGDAAPPAAKRPRVCDPQQGRRRMRRPAPARTRRGCPACAAWRA
ncbi:twin BRCT domain [Teratosphaeria destructans]|uniref:Twin BRCT domain n=1 Tax=Teratosphaeria destructans TaxID=418781 RepID=A0A9W7W1E5_9PEZI|nr:twin BRCT domain [Teratosphaeria destructans]